MKEILLWPCTLHWMRSSRVAREFGCQCQSRKSPVPEIIDPVFTKTSPKRSFCMTENERFGLVFTKTGSINSGMHGVRSQNPPIQWNLRGGR